MANYDFLSASDGTGDASLMHITATRIVGATAITVDTVVGVPAKFIGTSGNLLSSGLLDPTTVTNFRGHTASGALQIDAFEPGSTDKGNTATQVVIIKPNTGWANRVATFIQNATGLGTPEAHTTSSINNSGSITTGSFSNTGAYTGTNGSISSAYLTNPYKFSVYASVSTNIASGATTKVQLNSKTFDTNSNFDATTNYRFTAPVTGFYFITACVQVSNAGMSTSATGTGSIYKNGSEWKRGQLIVGSGNGLTTITAQITDLMQLTTGDYVELYAYNGDGASARNTGFGQNITYMSGFLVSPT